MQDSKEAKSEGTKAGHQSPVHSEAPKMHLQVQSLRNYLSFVCIVVVGGGEFTVYIRYCHFYSFSLMKHLKHNILANISFENITMVSKWSSYVANAYDITICICIFKNIYENFYFSFKIEIALIFTFLI